MNKKAVHAGDQFATDGLNMAEIQMDQAEIFEKEMKPGPPAEPK